MKVEDFISIINADFFVGVPDSQLKTIINYLMYKYGVDPKHHIIAANEGNCTAIAAGYYLSTGSIPVVYLQNSGEGNIINPVASLLSDRVYAIPEIFIIGWRGEPGIHDEPQHIYQGEITLKLLEDMDIEYYVIEPLTQKKEVEVVMQRFRVILEAGRSVAFVIRKNAITDSPSVKYVNDNYMCREEIIKHIVAISGKDPIVSTTGKASRELFEIRENNEQSHKYDFLTVGSMGHSSSIALGIAINKPSHRIWCIDGDGAFLMHMGAVAIIGSIKPKNLVHVVINNYAHETVGGMPTVSEKVNIVEIAKSCGYPYAVCVEDFSKLDFELREATKRNELSLIEVKSSLGSRENLGRPTISTIENKNEFIEYLKSL